MKYEWDICSQKHCTYTTATLYSNYDGHYIDHVWQDLGPNSIWVTATDQRGVVLTAIDAAIVDVPINAVEMTISKPAFLGHPVEITGTVIPFSATTPILHTVRTLKYDPRSDPDTWYFRAWEGGAEEIVQTTFLSPFDVLGWCSQNEVSSSCTTATVSLETPVTASKNTSTKEIHPDELITYTITVAEKSNLGDATEVSVTDPVPQDTTCCAFIGQGGKFDGSSIVWTGMTVPSGSDLKLTYVVTANQAPSGTIISNMAWGAWGEITIKTNLVKTTITDRPPPITYHQYLPTIQNNHTITP